MSPSTSADPHDRLAGSPSALVVEDDPLVSELTSRMLHELHWDVEVVSHGLDALRRAHRLPFLVALVDIGLGREPDGIECADWIQRLYRIPVVFVTGYTDTDTLKRAAAIHPLSYLVKPLTLAQLAAVLELSRSRTSDIPGGDPTEGRHLMTQDTTTRDGSGRAGHLRIDAHRYPSGFAELSAIEWQIISDITETPSAQAVGARRHRSTHTINNHLKAIFRKLEVHSVAELLALVIRLTQYR